MPTTMQGVSLYGISTQGKVKVVALVFVAHLSFSVTQGLFPGEGLEVYRLSNKVITLFNFWCDSISAHAVIISIRSSVEHKSNTGTGKKL